MFRSRHREVLRSIRLCGSAFFRRGAELKGQKTLGETYYNVFEVEILNRQISAQKGVTEHFCIIFCTESRTWQRERRYLKATGSVLKKPSTLQKRAQHLPLKVVSVAILAQASIQIKV